MDGLEKEISDELRRSQGLSETGGIYVPSAVGSRAWTGGDSLVGTQLLADQYASYLRERSTLARMGATVLTGLVGDVEIPAGRSFGARYFAVGGAEIRPNRAKSEKRAFSICLCTPLFVYLHNSNCMKGYDGFA